MNLGPFSKSSQVATDPGKVSRVEGEAKAMEVGPQGFPFHRDPRTYGIFLPT